MPKRGTPERPKIIKCVDCTFDLSISVTEDIGDSQLNEFILLQSWSPPEIKLARPGMGFRHFLRYVQNPVALFISTLHVRLQASSWSSLNVSFSSHSTKRISSLQVRCNWHDIET